MEGRLFTFLGTIGGHGQEWIVLSHFVLALVIVFLVARAGTRKMQLVPTGSQNVMEAFIGGVISIGKDTMGEENAKRYLPLIGALGLVIVVSNLMGVIPGFESPTANINFTLALALIVFVYYNYLGIKKNGFINYFKHFMGPMPILAPLMFPIEIISHMSRIVSLSFRLFGAIRGDDMFLMVLLMLVPWIIPLSGFFMLTAFGVLQAFVFMILTYVYIAGSIMMEHEDH
ncbi:MAG: ATP synthase subunit a [Arcobacter lacus]|jgi:F-type H+-transporting ATPase subunit a|nr:MAG: ATP synthase subunit a [Arcobacter lacus]